MIVVIARVRVQPQERELLEELLTTMQQKSRVEDGCINYGFFQSIEDENEYVAVEEWESQAALDAHFQQPHLAEFSAGLAKTVAAAPTIVFHEVSGTTSPSPLSPRGSVGD